MDVGEVRRRHEDSLLSLPNVHGVGSTRDRSTGVDVVVVFVTRKVPRSALPERDVIPAELDGVAVRVEEVGDVVAHGH